MSLAVLPPLARTIPAHWPENPASTALPLETVYAHRSCGSAPNSLGVVLVVSSPWRRWMGNRLAIRSRLRAGQRWGPVLTVLSLLAARPWWVDKPLAFGPYLLPSCRCCSSQYPPAWCALPMRLCRAFGRERQARVRGRWSQRFHLLAALWLTSPLRETLRSAELLRRSIRISNMTTEGLQFRPARYGGISVSPISGESISARREDLSPSPSRRSVMQVSIGPPRSGSGTSHQRVIPAYLWGACAEGAPREVPPDARFDFRNAVHLKDRSTLVARGVDYLAYFGR